MSATILAAMNEKELHRTVEKTYQALLSIVQSTALNKKVLYRPPFTFLHKLLVETLSPYGIFSDEQLIFSQLVTKEDKAAFITRALAFVAFSLQDLGFTKTSCLLLVSPIKVLAGVAVTDTLEFLQQLVEVCQCRDQEVKENAASQVLEKGDARLYTSGVTFRKGLSVLQGVVRLFVRRRMKNRKSLETLPYDDSLKSGSLQMDIGTRFLKEFHDGQIHQGRISGIRNKTYEITYDALNEMKEQIDEIEMVILLEESSRLTRMRDAAKEADPVLTDLPDLSNQLQRDSSGLPLKKRSLYRSYTRLDTAAIYMNGVKSKSRGNLKRSQSQRITIADIKFDNSASVDRPSSSKLDRRLSVGQEDLEINKSRGQANSMHDIFSSADEGRHADGDGEKVPEKDKSTLLSSIPEWQISLRQKLAEGQTPASLDSITSQSGFPGSERQLNTVADDDADKEKKLNSSVPDIRNNPALSPFLAFPKIEIPGTRSLSELSKAVPKRTVATLRNNKCNKADEDIERNEDTLRREIGTRDSTSRESSGVTEPAHIDGASDEIRHRLLKSPPTPMVDSPGFTTMYQAIDQKAQEKMALFRDIVGRIDGYMKRKHLRVIDLFRFCDADGNGSISPQEMLDTLAQMEIHLSPTQAEEFIGYIDRDGNGSIDIDEFEELVRVARRNEAQREQLKKEFSSAKKAALQHEIDEKNERRLKLLVKHRQRISDECKRIIAEGVAEEDPLEEELETDSTESVSNATISVAHLKGLLLRMQLPGVDEPLVDRFLQKCIAAEKSEQLLAMAPPAPKAVKNKDAKQYSSDSEVTFFQLIKVLDDLEWAKRPNRFLDTAWLNHFDSQMERAMREYELL